MAEPQPVPRISAPSVGYLGIRGRCASVVSANGVEPIAALPSKCNRVYLGSSGELFASTYDNLFRYRDGVAKIVPGIKSMDAFSAAPDGSLWSVSSEAIGHRVDGSWSFEPSTSLGPDERVLQAVTVDRAGHVYVASLEAVYRRDGARWVRLSVILRKGDHHFGINPVMFFKRLHLGGDGRVYVVEDARVFRIEGDRLRQLPLPLKRPVNDVAVAADGTLYVRHNHDDIAILSAAGTVRRELSAERGDFDGRKVEDLAVDGQGRFWFSTEAGVYVLEPDGDRIFWPTGSYPGLDGPVRTLAISGDGPETLPASLGVDDHGVSTDRLSIV